MTLIESITTVLNHAIQNHEDKAFIEYLDILQFKTALKDLDNANSSNIANLSDDEIMDTLKFKRDES